MNRKSTSDKRTDAGPKGAAAGPKAGNSRPPKGAESKPPPSLASLREEIDRLDQQLVELLNRRAEVVVRVGQFKQDRGLEVWSAAREDEVIAQALSDRK